MVRRSPAWPAVAARADRARAGRPHRASRPDPRAGARTVGGARTSRGCTCRRTSTAQSVEQRIVEAAAVLPARRRSHRLGGAAVARRPLVRRPRRATGVTRLPVTLATGATHDRGRSPASRSPRSACGPDDIELVDGMPVTIAGPVGRSSRCGTPPTGATPSWRIDMAAYYDLVSIDEVRRYAGAPAGWTGHRAVPARRSHCRRERLVASRGRGSAWSWTDGRGASAAAGEPPGLRPVRAARRRPRTCSTPRPAWPSSTTEPSTSRVAAAQDRDREEAFRRGRHRVPHGPGRRLDDRDRLAARMRRGPRRRARCAAPSRRAVDDSSRRRGGLRPARSSSGAT